MKGDGKTEDFPQHRAISLALRLGADLLGNSTGNKNFVELLTYLWNHVGHCEKAEKRI